MNFITIAELNNDIVNNMHLIPKDVDIVVGVPRSGMLVATIIALYLNIPLTDIDSFINGKLYSTGSTKNIDNVIKNYCEIKTALIVEDSSNTGNSIIEAREKLSAITFVKKIFLSVYVTKAAIDKVDIYFRKIEQPRVFEWNFMHSDDLIHACVDIDGVLCMDPTYEENDDGEKYIKFILMAIPRYIPTKKIGWIVTSRLEKYRKETEKWLEKNGIEYGQLIMMNLETAQERRELNNHAEYKANIYKKLDEAYWFVESDRSQAREIANRTGKAVFCVNAQQFYNMKINNKIKYYLKRKIRIYSVKIIKFILPDKAIILLKQKVKNYKK